MSDTPSASHSNVYVKNLADHIDDQILGSIFEAYGTIKSACVMLDQHTQRSRNFGFVKFAEIKSAEAAIDALNNQEVAGRKLLVKLADADAGEKPMPETTPSDNLYVKGLHPNITEASLEAIFSQYGNVQQLKILSRPGQGSTGEALVRMRDVGQAEWAKQKLHNAILEGGTIPVLVRYADTPEDKVRRKTQAVKKPQRYMYPPTMHDGAAYLPMMPPMPDFDHFSASLPHSHPFMAGPNGGAAAASDLCNLYVNDLPPEADDLFLYKTFAPLGAITSVRVMKDEQGQPRGFGFVKYVRPQDAVLAIQHVNGKQINGKTLHVSLKTAPSKHNALSPDNGPGRGRSMPAGPMGPLPPHAAMIPLMQGMHVQVGLGPPLPVQHVPGPGPQAQAGTVTSIPPQ